MAVDMSMLLTALALILLVLAVVLVVLSKLRRPPSGNSDSLAAEMHSLERRLSNLDQKLTHFISKTSTEIRNIEEHFRVPNGPNDAYEVFPGPRPH
jgi:hypothetical protein